MEINEIQKLLPHRYPFLLVDRILEVEPGKRAVGLKNVTINEPFFQGHFPGQPVMPGVLILEALAQVAAVAIFSLPQYAGKIGFYAGIDGVRFRQPVTPGDQLRLEAAITRIKGPVAKCQARAYVEDKLVTEGELMFAMEK
ncbi:MAG: 3-hydroxyacyl-ACP dehydratase FabZ [Firmicutes bacterium]|nr:3-hydroxyacyl-ACP dehydratase FabZ [Bacillota bacterium]